MTHGPLRQGGTQPARVPDSDPKVPPAIPTHCPVCKEPVTLAQFAKLYDRKGNRKYIRCKACVYESVSKAQRLHSLKTLARHAEGWSNRKLAFEISYYEDRIRVLRKQMNKGKNI